MERADDAKQPARGKGKGMGKGGEAAGEGIVYTALHLSVSIQFTFCDC